MTQALERVIREGVAGRENRRELVGLLGGSVLTAAWTSFFDSWWLALAIAADLTAVAVYARVIAPRRRLRAERALAELYAAPETVVEIAYRASGRIVIVLRDGARITLRFYRAMVAQRAREIAAACPNAYLHESAPGQRALAPPRAQLLPPK